MWPVRVPSSFLMRHGGGSFQPGPGFSLAVWQSPGDKIGPRARVGCAGSALKPGAVGLALACMSAKRNNPRIAKNNKSNSPGTITLGSVTGTLSAIPGKISPAAREMSAQFAAAE